GAVDFPSFKMLSIDIPAFDSSDHLFFENFADAIHQAEKSMSALLQKKCDKEILARQIQFSVAVGVEYFPEIAKLRALRILWKQLLERYHLPDVPAFIQVEKSWKNNSADEPYKNILRHTTEAMSAIIGGCDILFLKSTDQTASLSNDFFQRIT